MSQPESRGGTKERMQACQLGRDGGGGRIQKGKRGRGIVQKGSVGLREPSAFRPKRAAGGWKRRRVIIVMIVIITIITISIVAGDNGIFVVDLFDATTVSIKRALF